MIVTDAVLIFETMEGTTIFTSEWNDLEKDQYAPESDTRAMTRIVLKSDLTKNHVFTFRNKDDMNRLKKLIKQKKHSVHDTKCITKVQSIHDIRQELLTKDQKLKRSYEELVNGGILLEEEFWMNLDPKLQHIIDQKEIDIVITKGKASALLSDLVTEEQTPDKDPEMKEHIFSLYPAVKLAYEDNVPHKMQENEFWLIYLKSDSYRKDKGLGVGPQSTVDLFQKYQMRLDQESVSSIRDSGKVSKKPKVNPEVDLTATSNDYAFKEITDLEDRGRISSAAPVVGKYNRSSSLIVGEVKRSDGLMLVHEGGEMEELEAMSPPQSVPVRSTSEVLRQRMSASSKVLSAIKDIETNCDISTVVPSPSSAEKYMVQMDELCPALSAEDRDMPADLANEIKDEFTQVAQLLKHFYSRLDNDGIGADLERKVIRPLRLALHALSVV